MGIEERPNTTEERVASEGWERRGRCWATFEQVLGYYWAGYCAAFGRVLEAWGLGWVVSLLSSYCTLFPLHLFSLVCVSVFVCVLVSFTFFLGS